MNKSQKTTRSWFTTIAAAIIGLVILAVSLLLLPISNILAGVTFGIGMLLVIISTVVAIDGKKGSLGELLYILTFWR